MSHKMETNLNNLRKDQKQIITDENRNMRQLDKIEHMQKALAEDFTSVKASLEATDKLKQRASQNFEAIDKENIDDKKKLESAIQALEKTLN